MKEIVQIKFGSHLYGTATAESDLDIKAVHLPSARDILLQRVRPVISETRRKAPGEKNGAEDTDLESYSLDKFLKLLSEGQTVALDMFFAPDEAMLTAPDPLWQEIRSLAPKILNKKTASFLGYCRKQASKYALKGARVSAARQALAFLEEIEARHGSSEKLGVCAEEIDGFAAGNDFLSVGETPQPNGPAARYFEICGRKALFDASVKSARAMVQRLTEEYGARALAAEKNEGADPKALSHAVRIAREALEFLSSGHITFPRPEAKHLLAIKQGKIPFAEVSEEIETLLKEVELAAETSPLQESYDERAVDDFIEGVYRGIVIAA